jgi:hypothetical protein
MKVGSNATFFISMKKKIYTIIIICLLLQIAAIAQTIKIAKDGLVNVNGEDKFYLIKENAILGVGDFRWQNLNHQDLAFLKYTPNYYNTYNNRSSAAYTMVMTQSGNSCIIDQFNSLSMHKSIAKELYNSGMYSNGQIVDNMERTFIIAHYGLYISRPNNATIAEPVISYNDEPKKMLEVADAKSFDITALIIKNSKIFYQQKKKAEYVSTTVDNTTTLTFTNTDGKQSCIATYIKGSDEWSIKNLLTGQTEKILYNEAEPLQDLAQYCILHHYF